MLVSPLLDLIIIYYKKGENDWQRRVIINHPECGIRRV